MCLIHVNAIKWIRCDARRNIWAWEEKPIHRRVGENLKSTACAVRGISEAGFGIHISLCKVVFNSFACELFTHLEAAIEGAISRKAAHSRRQETGSRPRSQPCLCSASASVWIVCCFSASLGEDVSVDGSSKVLLFVSRFLAACTWLMFHLDSGTQKAHFRLWTYIFRIIIRSWRNSLNWSFLSNAHIQWTNTASSTRNYGNSLDPTSTLVVQNHHDRQPKIPSGCVLDSTNTAYVLTLYIITFK